MEVDADGQWINVGKVVVFGVLIAGGLWSLGRHDIEETSAALRPFFAGGLTGLVQAMGYTFIALQGFDLIAAVGGEVREPVRTIPRAMIFSLAIALLIYLPLLFVISTVGTVPGQSITTAAAADPENIVALAAERFLGPLGYWLVIVAAVLSMFSALEANLLAASWIARTMARDRTLPSWISHVTPRRRAPIFAVLVTALLVSSIILVLTDVGSAGAASSLMFLITFAVAHWIAILVRQRSGVRPSPFRVPLFPAVPVLGGLACLSLAVFQGIAVPSAGILTVIWLSLGGLLFLALFAQRARVRDATSVALNPELVTLRGRAPLVLVPIANPHNAAPMIALASALVPDKVGRVLGQVVVTATADWQPRLDDRPIQQSQAVVSQILGAAVATGVKIEILTTVASQPMLDIARVAGLHRCDTVLVGLSQLESEGAGNQLESLLNVLESNVVVLRSQNGWQLDQAKRILIPVAGRGGHERLLALLLGSLLRGYPREIALLRVLPLTATPEEQRTAKRDLRRLGDDIDPTCTVEIVRSDDALAVIAEHAEKSDLIILGVQRHGHRKRLFGEFTRQLAIRATCPMIIMSSRG